jgi:hypothetical protein
MLRSRPLPAPPRIGHLSVTSAGVLTHVWRKAVGASDRRQVQRRLKASTRAATAGRRAGTSRS